MRTTTLTFLVVMASLFGCKISSQRQTSITPNEGLNDILAPKERNFTAAELAIGKRLCDSMAKKREFFNNMDINKAYQYRMLGELKNCSGAPFSTGQFVVDLKNVSTEYQYVATNARTYDYFKDVVTDVTGVMGVICSNIPVSTSVSNTVLIGNASYGVTLLIKDGYDRYEVTKSVKGVIASAESVNVITQANQATNKHYGVEKERTLSSVCAGSTNISYLKQTWVEAVAGF